MIPFVDVLQVLAITAATSLVAAVVGLLLLRAARRRSFATSLGIVIVVAVAAVLLGAIATGSAMFLSGHDLRVLLVVVALAGVAGVATAAVLARGLVGGVRALGTAAHGLADGSYRSPGIPLNAELYRLDVQLADLDALLRQGRQRERDLEASRRDLVAWVSHDLRTPLAGIRAMAEALEDGVVSDDDTVARYHVGIRREADRLSLMVDDLFELSRINARALHLTLQDVALGDVVSDAVATAQPVARARGVRIDASAGSDLHFVRGSVPELGRVLLNLLANAVRHTPAGGVVFVDAKNGMGSVTVEVRDGCGGIPEVDLPHVFDVAFRGTTARTPGTEGGAGLGLAIARGLVEAHSGTIAVANVPGGCCAQVVLPATGSVAVQSRSN